MAKSLRKSARSDPGEDNTPEQPKLARDDELAGSNEDLDKELDELFEDVSKGFQDQWDRSNEQIDYWEVFNCKLGQNQFYAGNSKIFVPIVRNAINARKTRFANQIFPIAGRYVECTSESGDKPYALMSLLEHYVRKSQLRTRVAPPLCVNGDVEGQYNVYVSWVKNERHVVWKVTKSAFEMGGKQDNPVPDNDDKAEDQIEDIKEEIVFHGYPHVEVLADADVLILPQTADTVEEALDVGGSVTVLRRWSKTKLKKMIRDGDIREEIGKNLLKELTSEKKMETVDKAKHMTEAAGIRTGRGGSRHAQVYEIWTKMAIKDPDTKQTDRRIVRVLSTGTNMHLSCKRNPYWSDKVPVISVPVEKVQGAFKGVSKVKACADIQYQANDAVNEGMDSLAYALMPIVMTDPNRNPRIGSMVLSLAAVWETDPKSTQLAKFPNLSKDALEIVSVCKGQVAETLSVSPAAITQQGMTGKKRSQAEVAQEQQVDILTTADVVTVQEEGVWTPILQRFIELDHQFRDKAITIRQFGEMGTKAEMQRIEPIQFDRRYAFRWFGVEAARTQQQVQLQIAAVNVVRGIPPQQYEGYRLNLVPVISLLIENAFGPRLAPLIFENMADQMPVPAEQENILLQSGFEPPTHLMDDDDQHVVSHSMLMQMLQAGEGVQPGVIKKIQTHIWSHIQQKQKKQAMAMQAQQGAPGVPGGAGPGVAGTPRAGAVPAPGRPGQQPPGAIHQDTIGPQSGAPPRLRNAGGM